MGPGAGSPPEGPGADAHPPHVGLPGRFLTGLPPETLYSLLGVVFTYPQNL